MLSIRVLGQLEVQIDGEPVAIPSRPAEMLLAYLVLNPGKRHRREKLAGLLWPESDEDNARSNLRHALWRLRKALGGRFIEADKASIGFEPDSAYWLDAQVLESDPEGASLDDVLEGLTASTGELLPGFYEDWIVSERERLQLLLERKLNSLLDGLLDAGRWADVLEWGERWIALGRAPEPAYRALMTAHAAQGDRSKVAVIFERCRDALRQELGVDPSPDTIALFERLSKGEPITVRVSAGPRHNLTMPQTSFIGRKAELDAIMTRLSDPDCRLLSLIGPGGIGKTRLALEAAHGQLEAFTAGVWFVPLAAVSAPEHLTSAIVEALPFDLAGAEDPERQLHDFLREKTMLLLLDGFEHLMAGADLVAETLTQAPRIKFLVTSRERLNLQSEWLVDVVGMPVPSVGAAESPEDFDVVQLFIESARRVQAEIPLDSDQMNEVVRICRLVDGMPLAIELAATWTRMLSCQEVADEIEKGLEILATTTRDVPERHRSLTAVFDTSWQLLEAGERRSLEKLSVFRGGFQRQQAEQVAGASLPLLSSLSDRSYLQPTPPGRFDMHELLRRYAHARLSADPEALAEISGRHAAAYADLLHVWTEALRAAGRQQALETLTPEVDNLRAAWGWAVASRDTAALARAAEGLWLFYDIRSWFQEGSDAFQQAAEAARQDPGPDSDEAGDRVLAAALAYQAWFAWRLGRYSEANELASESLAQARAAADRRTEAFGLNLQGVIAMAQGEYSAAKEACQASLALWRAIGDAWGTAVALFNLGLASHALGEYAEAKLPYQEGLQIFKQIGHPSGATFSFDTLGRVARSLAELNEARKLCRESLAIRRELDDPWGVAACLDSLAVVEAALGEAGAANEACLESLRIREELGDRRGMATALSNLGHIAYLTEDLEKARGYTRQALALRQEIGDRKGIASSLNALAEIELHAGNEDAARTHAQEGLALRRELGERAGAASALITLGRIGLAQENWAEAQSAFQEALMTAMELEAPPLSLEALAGHARADAHTGEVVRAASTLGFVYTHPASGPELRQLAGAAYQQLQDEKRSQELAAAWEAGQSAQLEEIAGRLL